MNRETLIIDDDKIMCIMHERLCRLYKLPKPRAFTTAQEALAYILANDHPCQSYTILLDINMPVMNGWQFLEALGGYELSADIYLILLSSSVDRSDMERATGYPLVDAFVSKPLNTSKIQLLLQDSKLRERTDVLS